jgi:hypothetical protein
MDTDDILVAFNLAVNFIAGVFGLETSVAYPTTLVILGLMTTFVTKRAGWLFRRAVTVTYKVGKWLVVGPQLSDLGKSVVEVLKNNPATLNTYNGINVVHLGVDLRNGVTCWVLDGGPSLTQRLTRTDKKVIAKVAKQIEDDLIAQRDEKDMKEILTAVKFPGVGRFMQATNYPDKSKETTNLGWLAGVPGINFGPPQSGHLPEPNGDHAPILCTFNPDGAKGT